MKRFLAWMLVLCTVICLVASQAVASGDATFTIKKTTYNKADLPSFLSALRWNMSLEDIKTADVGAAPIITGDTVEFYGVPVLDRLANVVCIFSGKEYAQLDLVMVIMTNKNADAKENYDLLCQELTKQYGKAPLTSRRWLSKDTTGGGTSTTVNGVYQQYTVYNNLAFRLSCTLEDWDGEMMASVLIQRGTYVAQAGGQTGENVTNESPQVVFALGTATPSPAKTPSPDTTPMPGVSVALAGIEWGMDHETIRAIEGKKPTEDNDTWLRFTGTLEDGRAVSTAYYFENEALVKVYYIFLDSYDQPNQHITEFEEFSAPLIEALGKPYMSGMQWHETRYKGKPDYYGLAVSLGELTYREIWMEDDFTLTHALEGDDHLIYHYLQYSAPPASK